VFQKNNIHKKKSKCRERSSECKYIIQFFLYILEYLYTIKSHEITLWSYRHNINIWNKTFSHIDNVSWTSFDNATSDKTLVMLTQNGSMSLLVWIGCPFIFLMHWAWLGLFSHFSFFFPPLSLSLSLSLFPFPFLFPLSSLLPVRLPLTFEKLNHT